MPRPFIPLPDDLFNQAVEIYNEGYLSVRDIAKKLGIGSAKLTNNFKRRGVAVRSKKGWVRNIKKDDLYKAKELYDSGLSLAATARSLGMGLGRLKRAFPKEWLRSREETLRLRAEKYRQTCTGKYGVENPMKDPVVFNKQQQQGFSTKPYTFPSGRIVTVQGFEPQALDMLLKEGVKEEDIFVGKDVPAIKYSWSKKSRIYYPDIYVKSANMIVEVKSTFTYDKEVDKNHAKWEATKKQGFDFRSMIFDNKGLLRD